MILPETSGDLTRDWMQFALGRAFPGIELRSARPDGAIVGTASKVRILLEFEPGRDAGCPSTLYVKGGLHGPEQLALAHGGFSNEARFFSEFAPRLSELELPRSFFAEAEPETGQGIVILEDLGARGVTFGRATEPLAVDQMAAALEWLATMHGRFWGSPMLADLKPWPGVIETISDYFLTGDFWGQMVSRPLARTVPDTMRNVDNVRLALHAMWAKFRDRRETFVHGDTHLGNMYFLGDGKPAFLDWQSPMAGPCADDVTYSLIGSLTVADRRANEEALLRHYLAALGAVIGSDAPAYEDFWLQYRQQVMHGFMWVATPPQMQPDDIVQANTERFCAAFEDLETPKALGLAL